MKNGGKSLHKKAPVYPTLLKWAIAFLARTSVSVYKEVRVQISVDENQFLVKVVADEMLI